MNTTRSKSLRTPLARAKGLGSAKEGTDHFWLQRISAVALVPLIVWLCFSIASLPGRDYVNVREWISSPFVSIMLILLLIAAFTHARLGLQEVIVDYVGTHAKRTVGFIAVTFAAGVLAVVGIFSILRIAFTA